METVIIPEPKKPQTVGEIAAHDVRKAEVFKKFGIEFCCGGNKSLDKACADLNLDLHLVEKELTRATTITKSYSFDFDRWQPDFLCDYIYNEHHVFFYEESPVIAGMLEKIVPHHSKKHPALLKVEELFYKLKEELIKHFDEEEEVVFPLIRKLQEVKKSGEVSNHAETKQLQVVLRSLQEEHVEAGFILRELRQVTNDYTPPAGACTSFKLLYHKLKRLEEDLHQHIHLENNVLFPKALQLGNELSGLN